MKSLTSMLTIHRLLLTRQWYLFLSPRLPQPEVVEDSKKKKTIMLEENWHLQGRQAGKLSKTTATTEWLKISIQESCIFCWIHLSRKFKEIWCLGSWMNYSSCCIFLLIPLSPYVTANFLLVRLSNQVISFGYDIFMEWIIHSVFLHTV